MKTKKKKVFKRSFNSSVNKLKVQNFNRKIQKNIRSYFTGLWSTQFKIFIAYIGFALLGAILLFISELNSPKSKEFGFDFSDALFTSVSAFSNTGLIVVRTGDFFSIFGQIVIYFLIQIGGFGLLSTFFLLGKSFNRIFFKDKEFKSILGHAEKGQTKISSSFRILIVIFFIIFAFQLITTFILWPIFYLVDFNISYQGIENIDNGVGYQNLSLSFWNALFTVGSATNNAGFDLFSSASDGSLSTFFGGAGIAVQSIVLILFIFGGIGYMVIYDIWKYSTFFIYKHHPRIYRKLLNAKLSEQFEVRPKISIYTKICLLGNLLIIITSLVLAYSFVWISFKTFNGTIASNSDTHSWVEQKLTGIIQTNNGEINTGVIYSQSEVNYAIFFNTMSTRSAGFSTFNMGNMAESTKWLFSILMVIGTSPSSTGGGVRVTTIVVIMSMIWQKFKGVEYSTIFKKQIAPKTKINASITLIFAVFLILISSFFITLFDEKIVFSDAFFVASSAFGTTGLSTVALGDIDFVSYFVIIPIMIVGQLGITNTLETFNVGRKKYTKTEPTPIEFRVG